MPGGDRTGPEAYGPRTGRNLGYCAGYNSPGFTKGIPRGRGRGLRRRFWVRDRNFWYRSNYPGPYYESKLYNQVPLPVHNQDDEKSYLEGMVKNLEEELKTIQERLQYLSKEKK